MLICPPYPCPIYVTVLSQAVSVDSWEDLPQLLDELLDMPDDTIDQLQVIVKVLHVFHEIEDLAIIATNRKIDL